jgi:hypothetical protein
VTNHAWVRLSDNLAAENAVLRGENDYLLRENTERLVKLKEAEAECVRWACMMTDGNTRIEQLEAELKGAQYIEGCALADAKQAEDGFEGALATAEARRQRIEQLEAGLQEYGRHQGRCPKGFLRESPNIKPPCVCGLDALLAAEPPEESQG